jgi:hypothetical protein
MSDHASVRSKSRPRPYEGEPSITTLAGLKKETHTAVVPYFAPVVALYNVVAATAGLPAVKWHGSFESDKGQSREHR